ncbi:hypothetical protein C2E20_7928 isoform A [Micractinium conductrix]|uniref:Uncharacterized protein n=1 Tax=Micractinium conductrix TaxID=554055 RepID=A0A2P6V308_9CHLO|nr:hypothetical protein C2E20_7928 isoform B [Micractinium conductrix]PSC68455.1 hypothetical protein C2E20_7928 isoform A [Micractinium conductrix]|eukprot:PSC68454.1 hypothetical protein C2E20_7928 isoform B [Micractinium conductrix]
MSIPFLLRALQYPPAGATPSPDDPEQLQAVVVWLEHTKVRRYPIEGRATLQSADPATARAALQQYLADLECPLRLQPGNGGERAMLQWLLTHAVGLEYQDAAEALNMAAAHAEAEAGPPEEWSEASLPPLPDITAEPVRAALLQLQQLLHVDAAQHQQQQEGGRGAAEATPEGLHRAHAMLETCVLPALAELAKQRHAAAGGGNAPTAAAAGGSGAAQHAAVAAMLAQYPLGFSTGDAGADLAATILRMLYIKDLRALQTAVDAAIVQVQEYTANPRTDASLGKVGR